MLLIPAIIQGPKLPLTVGYMYSLILASILTLLLNLPFQTMSFLETWSHVQTHHRPELIETHSSTIDHEHGHSHDHEHRESDQDHGSDSGSEPHSHEKDFWGLFSSAALGFRPSHSHLLTFVLQPLPQFEEHELVCKAFCKGLLRPPIP